MPWYKSGTVSVVLNSNAVIGTGTAFLSNGRVGDAFRGPDGAWYEVTNIASDSAMSISPSYKGANNAAGSYALAPMQGYVKDSADALRALVNTYGAKLAALGSTANFEILPVVNGGTGSSTPSAARAAIGLAAPTEITDAHLALTLGVTYKLVAPYTNSPVNGFPCSITVLRYDNEVALEGVQEGVANPVKYIKKRTGTSTWSAWGKFAINNAVGANADITSLSGLTTPLSAAQGGTGNNTGTAAKLAASAIVGAVGQSGGIPTGAIIERGSNANGEYTRFADGTQICRHKYQGQRILGTVAGAVFYAGGKEASLVYPMPFSSAPSVSINAIGFTYECWWAPGGWASPLLAWPAGYIFTQTQRTQSDLFYLDLVAIGRWF